MIIHYDCFVSYEPWLGVRRFFSLLSFPGSLHNCKRAQVAARGPLLPLSGGGRGSDSLGSQFDPAVRRVPMSGSSSLATRPPALPCTRLLAPHRSRAGPKSGRESRLAGLGTDTFWQELLSPHFCEWSADFSAEHKRPQDSMCSSCGMQARTEMLASVGLQTIVAFLTVLYSLCKYLCVVHYSFFPSITPRSTVALWLCSQF